MSAYLYIQVAPEKADQAARFLRDHIANGTEVERLIHIVNSEDLAWCDTDECADPDHFRKYFTSKMGTGEIQVSRISEQVDDGDKTISVYEDITAILEALSEKFEVHYDDAGGFTKGEYYFSLEQARRITFDGDLLLGKERHRSLFALLSGSKEEAKERLSSQKMLSELKALDQDHEFYPTTSEIVESLYFDLLRPNPWHDVEGVSDRAREQGPYEHTTVSILDVGAGDGKLFRTIDEIAKDKSIHATLSLSRRFAIEKSQRLIDSYDDEVFVIGTDLFDQVLIDKRVDVIFSNPAYSIFSEWSTKVINEADCRSIYLVLPKRWASDLRIAEAIESREASVSVIGDFDFFDSEDRKARTYVQLIRVDLIDPDFRHTDYDHKTRVDAFDIWFDATFPIDLDASEDRLADYEKRNRRQQRLHELTTGHNLIERLEELYNKEMAGLMDNFIKIAGLDATLLKELGVSAEALKASLKLKISGLKNSYWVELFNNLDTITSRLTSSSRKELLGKLMQSTTVDFTASNAYNIVIWAIEHANLYCDSQLLILYWAFSSSENVRLYKSNTHFVKDTWRYNRHDEEQLTHYSLEYRLVDHLFDAISIAYDADRGMGPVARTRIEDILTIAANLGFQVKEKECDVEWVAGKKNLFYMSVEGKDELFMAVKAFKNGNLHLQFSTSFIKRFSLEAGRLNGWLRSPKETMDEMADLDEEEPNAMFGSNFRLTPTSLGTLLPYHEIETPQEDAGQSPSNSEDYSPEQKEAFGNGTLF